MEEIQKVGRIGVDLDGHDGFRFIVSYLRLCALGPVRCYYTRHGFHLELQRQASIVQNIDVRLWAGDDPERVRVDMGKAVDGDLRLFDRLFVFRVKDGEKYTRWGFDPLRVADPRPGNGVGCGD